MAVFRPPEPLYKAFDSLFEGTGPGAKRPFRFNAAGDSSAAVYHCIRRAAGYLTRLVAVPIYGSGPWSAPFPHSALLRFESPADWLFPVNPTSQQVNQTPPDTAKVDKSGQRVREMFGEIAPQYDRMNHLLSMNVDKLWRRKTVRRLAPKPGDAILDVCTGTGDLALAFNRYLKGQGTVVGTDFCAEMLEIARKKPVAHGSVSFSQADAQALPFDDNSFDIVTVAFGLRNVEDTDLGLRELTRVCRPGGKIGILEFTSPRAWPIRPLYGWYFRNVLPRIGQQLAKNKANAYDYLPQSVGEFPCYEQLTARMLQAGMSSADFKPLTFGIATLYLGKK